MLNLSGEKPITEFDEERLYSIKLVNSSKKSRLIVKWLAGIFIAGILSLFLPWQQNIDGTGMVTAFDPQERPQTIQTLIAGRIDKWYVHEGQYVNAGDTIMLITEIKEKFFDPELLSRMRSQIESKRQSIESKAAKAEALRNQIIALKKGLEFSLNKAQNKLQQAQMYVTIDSADLNAARVDNEIAQQQATRQQKLFEEGLVSLTNLEQRKLKFQQTQAKYISAMNKFMASKNDLLNANIELSSVEAEYADKISKAESDRNATLADIYESQAEISKLTIEYTNLEIRNGLYVIRAPQKGYVVKAVKQGIGETVKEGEEIVTIMPYAPHLAVELYIKPVDVPLIHKGCPVRLQFDGWPAIVFAGWPGASVGTFGGKVAVIDYINSKNGKFRLLVVPDSADKPWPEQIRMGTGVLGWAMLNNVFVGYEFWRQFNGFPPDFNSKIETKSFDSKKGKSKDDGAGEN